jgi:hypothetical protein
VGLELRHLDDDPRTREYMKAEVEADIEAGNLYYGKYLSPAGQEVWPDALTQAVTSYDDEWLQVTMTPTAYWLERYPRRTPSGGSTMAKVPSNAPQMLGEGEFNRFYIRGVCLRAIKDGINRIRIIRVKEVRQARAESVQLIGMLVDPSEILTDLRAHPGEPTTYGVPMGPNSGLSIEIPDQSSQPQ